MECTTVSNRDFLSGMVQADLLSTPGSISMIIYIYIVDVLTITVHPSSVQSFGRVTWGLFFASSHLSASQGASRFAIFERPMLNHP